MRVVIGFLLAFLIGAGCRFFRIPSPAPNAILGALLVVAMSVGYWLSLIHILSFVKLHRAPRLWMLRWN